MSRDVTEALAILMEMSDNELEKVPAALRELRNTEGDVSEKEAQCF